MIVFYFYEILYNDDDKSLYFVYVIIIDPKHYTILFITVQYIDSDKFVQNCKLFSILYVGNINNNII
jgi:hypothetical protein